jgi:tetratricopeptide (TPR) repeat protein
MLYLDVSLLSLGTILQRSNYLNDSLIVIESAVNHAPHVTENLWYLCNNYLLLSQFDKSFECFERVESQDDAYSARIDYIKNSFRCFRDLKITLLAMEKSLSEIPPELRLYRSLKKELEATNEMLEKEQVPWKVREFDEKFEDEKNSLIQRSQLCTKRYIDNAPEPVLFCDFPNDFSDSVMHVFALDLLDNYIDLKTELIDTYKINSLGIFKTIFVEDYLNEI